MKFQKNDGGRLHAGYQGNAGDCVCRAIAIATGKPYQEIYDRLAEGNASQRKTKHCNKNSKSARNGIKVNAKWFKEYMVELGFVWHPCMKIGTGCMVHLKDGEVPAQGRYVLSLSKHYAALIDGVLHDNHDCSREGTRCVYGWWELRQKQQSDVA